MAGDGKGEDVGMSAVESDCGIWAAVGDGADVGPVALEGRVMGETELSLLMSAMFGGGSGVSSSKVCTWSCLHLEMTATPRGLFVCRCRYAFMLGLALWVKMKHESVGKAERIVREEVRAGPSGGGRVLVCSDGRQGASCQHTTQVSLAACAATVSDQSRFERCRPCRRRVTTGCGV